MLNNHHKNSDCAFAESLVAYLYDEASAAEKRVFEAHLKNCATCDDELKEFGFARTAIHEWRVADFDQLPTPAFKIPAQTVHSTVETRKSQSWFDGLRQIFSFKPALAMSALIVLVALFSVAAFVFNFKTDEPIAENLKEKELVKTTVSPTVEKKEVEPKKTVSGENGETSKIANANPTIKVEEQKSVNAKAISVKASAIAPKNNAVKVVQTENKRNQKSNVAPKSDVPRFVETDDEEDDSVRLADLFDEIGTE